MSFIRDASDFLDNLFGVPEKSHNPLASLTDSQLYNGLSLEGIEPREPGSPIIPQDTPSDLDVQTFKNIQQKRSQSFNTVDIISFNADPNLFRCRIRKEVLYELLGYEAEDETTIGIGGPQGGAWRTFELPIMGNFLRLDFLNAKRNMNNGSNLNARFNSQESHTYVWTLGATTVGSQLVWRPLAPNNAAFQSAAPDVLSTSLMSRVVLVQFDDPNSPPIIAKDGQCFDTSFSTVYVTMKVNTPRLRVTSGFNAKIYGAEDARIMNANPVYGPGHGLWNNPDIHCVPFSISINGINTRPTMDSVNANATDTFNVIYQQALFNPTPANALVKGGVGVLWIHGFNFTGTGNTGSSYIVKVSLAHMRNNFGTFNKELWSMPISWKEVQLTASGVVADAFNYHIVFPKPIRVNLQPGDGVMVQVDNGASGAALNYLWSFFGYSYGPLSGGGFPTAPYYLNTLTEDPFPVDGITVG